MTVSAKSRSDRGRNGLSYWCILVLAVVRLGCNLNYDKLHDLAGNHRALRSIVEVGEFNETHFSWKRIRDNVCLLQPATIDEVSPLIVRQGHKLAPDTVKKMREVAHRRVIQGEQVPNDEKLFSLFEPHTQLDNAPARANRDDALADASG